MSKINDFLKKNTFEIICIIVMIILFAITQHLIKTKNINEINVIIIISLTIIMVISYMAITIKKLVDKLSDNYNSKEKLKFNGIILSILIIPSIHMLSNLIIYVNNNLTIYDSFEFLLTIFLSFVVIIILRQKKLI